MNRRDLQLLADARVADARVLIEAERWAAAYYLLGYAVECGLKACVADQLQAGEIPEKTFVNDFYTHRLDKLLGISGVKGLLEERVRTDREFQLNWQSVGDWNETFRYKHSTTEVKARDMLFAVTDPTSGVLPWLKAQWSKSS